MNYIYYYYSLPSARIKSFILWLRSQALNELYWSLIPGNSTRPFSTMIVKQWSTRGETGVHGSSHKTRKKSSPGGGSWEGENSWLGGNHHLRAHREGGDQNGAGRGGRTRERRPSGEEIEIYPPATATRRSQLQRRTEEQRCGDGCSPWRSQIAQGTASNRKKWRSRVDDLWSGPVEGEHQGMYCHEGDVRK